MATSAVFKFKRWTGCVTVSQFAAARVGVTQCTSGPDDYNLSHAKPRLHPPPRSGTRGFILDFVQNSSCVRAMLFRNTVSVGWKLIPRLTAASLARLGERRSAGGGGGRVMSTARKVGDKGRQAAVCRILALSYFSQVLAARRRIQTEYWVRQKSTEHCQVWDHFTFLGNCPPTPPLNQHQHSVLT